jgi:hypothetical protein
MSTRLNPPPGWPRPRYGPAGPDRRPRMFTLISVSQASPGYPRAPGPCRNDLADACYTHDHLAVARRQVHGLLPVRAPRPGVDQAWRDQFQRTEEAGELRYRVVVHPRRPGRVGAEALVRRIAVAVLADLDGLEFRSIPGGPVSVRGRSIPAGEAVRLRWWCPNRGRCGRPCPGRGRAAGRGSSR